MQERLQKLIAQAGIASRRHAEELITAGQVIGLIDDVPTCAELIERMVAECRERLGASSAAFA